MRPQGALEGAVRLLLCLVRSGLGALALGLSTPLAAQTVGEVLFHTKLSALTPGMQGLLTPGDEYGVGVARMGDLDGDTATELAVGAYLDDDGGQAAGAVWIQFLYADGSLKSSQKISATQGGFTGALDPGDWFGNAVSSVGDLDGDGLEELAVGARLDDDGGKDRGAVWILFLHADGTVRTHQKISSTSGGFAGQLDDSDFFGVSVAGMGDIDGDGVGELAVGARGDDDGGSDLGAVWMLFLQADGSVKTSQKISRTSGGFTGDLDPKDHFGDGLGRVEDVNGDGVDELAVGVPNDDDGKVANGAVYLCFLSPLGTVLFSQKISALEGSFGGTLDQDRFGRSVASLGDLDQDGVTDIAVGAIIDQDGGVYGAGAVWVLFLNPDGTVKTHQKISLTSGNFNGLLDSQDFLGGSIAALGDLDGNGAVDIAVGARGDDDEPTNSGAVWMLYLQSGFGNALTWDVASLSAATGGTQSLSVNAGGVHALDLYFLLGSSSGTAPGTWIDGLSLPLNTPDPYFSFTLYSPNSSLLSNSFGILDFQGKANAAVHFLPGAASGLVGITLHHAYLVFGFGTPAQMVSNAAPLTILP